MAKVRIRIGDSEAEVDSRDFYVDNQSVGQVIGEVSRHLRAHSAKTVRGEAAHETRKPQEPNLEYLKSLDDAEVHEPEFHGPAQISGYEVKPKLEMLEKDSFFDRPRTVSETVGQLREYGWIASPLEVSKTLTGMARHRELTKDSQNNRSYYSARENLLAG